MGSVIIGLFTGFMVSIFLGVADFSRMATLPLINVPIPFRFGLDFDIVTFISFAIIYVALTLEVLGDITATSMVSAEPKISLRRVEDQKVRIIRKPMIPAAMWIFRFISVAFHVAGLRCEGDSKEYSKLYTIV